MFLAYFKDERERKLRGNDDCVVHPLKSARMESDSKYVDKFVSRIITSYSFEKHFMEEIKNYHKWFSIIYNYSEKFPRILRVLSLVTNISIMLFIQAITYDIVNPNDGSCSLLLTYDACIEPRSSYDSSKSKCMWEFDKSSGTCKFIEPNQDISVIIFIAIVGAVVGTPIALLMDWLILNYLTPPVKSLETLSTAVSRITKRLAVNLDSSQAIITKLTAEMRMYRETLTPTEIKEFDGNRLNILSVTIFLYKYIS
jgi:hypothetical protein